LAIRVKRTNHKTQSPRTTNNVQLKNQKNEKTEISRGKGKKKKKKKDTGRRKGARASEPSEVTKNRYL